MKIKIIAVGKKMPSWVVEGFEEYSKRLKGKENLQLIEIPLSTRGKNADIPRLMKKEGDAMLAATKSEDWVVALAIDGKSFSTEAFSNQIKLWQEKGGNLVFFIGGPEGLAEQCLQRANQRISFSQFTLPHPLVRIVLIEQLYRGFSLIAGHPYHK